MIKKLDFTVIILCPDKNINGLKGTLRSIENHFSDRKSICITGNNVTPEELKAMKTLCPAYKGKDTITSLMNVGMKKVDTEWGFIIYSGSFVKPYAERKLYYFVESPKDVLYPIVDRKMNFVDGSSNGILLNKSTFKEVGDFPEIPLNKETINDFEMAKLLWVMEAMKHGCKFKGIIGLRIT